MPPEETMTLEAAGANALEALETPSEPALESKETPPAVEPGSSDKAPAESGAAPKPEDIQIPKYRYDEVSKKYEEVNKQMQELSKVLEGYKTFGTPEQIRTVLASIAELKGKPNAEPEIELDADEIAMRDTILKVLPHLAKNISNNPEIEQLKQQLNDMRGFVENSKAQAKAEYDKYIGKAEETISSLAKEIGLNVEDPKTLNIIAGAISQMIEDDPALADQFYKSRDMSVINKVFEDYKNRFFSGVQKKVANDILGDKKKLGELPKGVPSGGVGEGEKKVDTSKFKSFNDPSVYETALNLLGK